MKRANQKHLSQRSRNLVRSPPLSTVASEDAARRANETEEQRAKGTEDEPVGIAEAGGEATVANVMARVDEEDHLNDPGYEGDEEREGRDEAHEDGAGSMVAGAAHAEEESEA